MIPKGAIGRSDFRATSGIRAKCATVPRRVGDGQMLRRRQVRHRESSDRRGGSGGKRYLTGGAVFGGSGGMRK